MTTTYAGMIGIVVSARIPEGKNIFDDRNAGEKGVKGKGNIEEIIWNQLQKTFIDSTDDELFKFIDLCELNCKKLGLGNSEISDETIDNIKVQKDVNIGDIPLSR